MHTLIPQSNSDVEQSDSSWSQTFSLTKQMCSKHLMLALGLRTWFSKGTRVVLGSHHLLADYFCMERLSRHLHLQVVFV